MSSSTPNIGLTLPTGGERVSRQIINENNTKIDTYAGELSEQIGKKGKIYRVLITNGETTVGDYFPLSGEYLANAFVQVSNTNEIHFSENATVLILVHLVGKTDNSGRGWISLIGGNYNADSIAYGNYVTLDIPLVTSVSSSTIIKLKSNDATINVGGGGIIGSRILIIRIE